MLSCLLHILDRLLPCYTHMCIRVWQTSNSPIYGFHPCARGDWELLHCTASFELQISYAVLYQQDQFYKECFLCGVFEQKYHELAVHHSHRTHQHKVSGSTFLQQQYKVLHQLSPQSFHEGQTLVYVGTRYSRLFQAKLLFLSNSSLFPGEFRFAL